MIQTRSRSTVIRIVRLPATGLALALRRQERNSLLARGRGDDSAWVGLNDLNLFLVIVDYKEVPIPLGHLSKSPCRGRSRIGRANREAGSIARSENQIRECRTDRRKAYRYTLA